MNEIHFLGIPFNSDGTPPEVENPPRQLRAAGLIDSLRRSCAVRDRGDLPVPAATGCRDPRNGVLNWSSWQTVSEATSEAVRGILSAGGWPLVVGGDCSILVGIMAAARAVEARCGLLFVDAHGDFHTPDSSPTGEAADMELAALTGRSPSPIPTTSGPLLGDGDVVAIGIRESDGIDATPIRVVDARQLARGDQEAVVERAAEALAGRPVWLHFDVDVIDPGAMPVIYPAGDGLSFDETAGILEALLRCARVIGMSVTCFHPNLDPTGTATAGLAGLLTTVLAKGMVDGSQTRESAP